MLDFIDALSNYLNAASAREQLIASNIANANTPGFKTTDIDFSQALKNAMQGVENGANQPTAVGELPERPDGNNVSLERETLAMAETEARFRMAAQVVRAQLR